MTTTPVLPRYPLYIPSKGRYEEGYTPRFLIEDGVPFYLVVEPQEAEAYGARYGHERLLVLPWSGDDATRRAFCAARGIENGGLIAARNWIKEHSIAALGAERHWQLDDNIKMMRRWLGGKRLRCRSGVALRATEDFCDRYENVAIAGLNYSMFAMQPGGGSQRIPFRLNAHVYSCTLVLNSIPYRWRLAYNDDTDMCLQVLADGWCTVQVGAFMIDKVRTGTVKGGNTTDLYQGDGRLKMARSLERMWPGVVRTGRRFTRPQHIVANAWQKFDTPLKLKPGVDKAALAAAGPNEYGMHVVQVADTVRSPRIQRLLAEQQDKQQKEARRRDTP